jgi:hypothetical protein
MSRAQSPRVPEGSGVPEGRGVVCPKAEEWCSRGATSRRNRIAKACHAWISVEDVVAAAERRWCAEKAYAFRAKEVVCLTGERWWGDGRDEDVDATTQNRAKSKKEQPETEYRDA